MPSTIAISGSCHKEVYYERIRNFDAGVSSSLQYRSGRAGADTFRFIKNLKHSGVKIWQILPLNPAGYGNSPYQPYSSCAGDEIYISLEELYKQGLLKVLPEAFRKNAAKVDYQAVREWKEPYLREACSNFQETEDYQRFVEQPWVKTYGMFRALKKENGNRCWNEWKDEDKSWPETGAEVPDHIKEEVYYQMFLQYVFYCQWMAVKKAANDAGIRIMGDVPFYVGVDSVDVWAGKDNFLLNTDGRPIFIAGVPPDYFSATGQRWGNPIYDWDYLKESDYQFWLDRYRYSSRLFDMTVLTISGLLTPFGKFRQPVLLPLRGNGSRLPVRSAGYATEKLPDVELIRRRIWVIFVLRFLP